MAINNTKMLSCSTWREWHAVDHTTINGSFVWHPSHQGSGNFREESDRAIIRSRGVGGRRGRDWLSENSSPPLDKSSAISNLNTWFETAYTRLTPPPARQIPAWRREGEHKIPPLAEELFTFDNFWKREGQWAFLMVWPLVSLPHSIAVPTPNSRVTQT